MAGTTWPNLVAGTPARASDVEAKFDWLEGNLNPMLAGTQADDTYDLGTTSFRWRGVYATVIYPGGTSGNSIDLQAANVMRFNINSTEVLRINASGLFVGVGIGATGSLREVSINGGSDTAGGAVVRFSRNSVAKASIGSSSGILGDASDDTLIYVNSTNHLRFYVNGNEAGRIDGSTGSLWFGTTAGNFSGINRTLAIIGQSGRAGLEYGSTIADADNTAHGDLLGIHGNTTSTEKRLSIIRSLTDGSTGNERGGKLFFFVKDDGAATLTNALQIRTGGNIVVGTAAVATSATNGFLYISTCAGTPVGTPTSYTGASPLIVDTTNNIPYFYASGAWRSMGGIFGIKARGITSTTGNTVTNTAITVSGQGRIRNIWAFAGVGGTSTIMIYADGIPLAANQALVATTTVNTLNVFLRRNPSSISDANMLLSTFTAELVATSTAHLDIFFKQSFTVFHVGVASTTATTIVDYELGA